VATGVVNSLRCDNRDVLAADPHLDLAVDAPAEGRQLLRAEELALLLAEEHDFGADVYGKLEMADVDRHGRRDQGRDHGRQREDRADATRFHALERGRKRVVRDERIEAAEDQENQGSRRQRSERSGLDPRRETDGGTAAKT